MVERKSRLIVAWPTETSTFQNRKIKPLSTTIKKFRALFKDHSILDKGITCLEDLLLAHNKLK